MKLYTQNEPPGWQAMPHRTLRVGNFWHHEKPSIQGWSLQRPWLWRWGSEWVRSNAGPDGEVRQPVSDTTGVAEDGVRTSSWLVVTGAGGTRATARWRHFLVRVLEVGLPVRKSLSTLNNPLGHVGGDVFLLAYPRKWRANAKTYALNSWLSELMREFDQQI